MVIFRWRKELETGIELVDQQHKQIIEIANSFFISHKCCNDSKKIVECLNFLKNYVQYHFQTEEAYMIKCSYPDYLSHQGKHQYLSTQVQFFTVRLRAANYMPPVLNEFNVFLMGWLQEHTLHVDLDFATYYKAHISAGI